MVDALLITTTPTKTTMTTDRDGNRSNPYQPNPDMCCERCIFGTGRHAEWCFLVTDEMIAVIGPPRGFVRVGRDSVLRCDVYQRDVHPEVADCVGAGI